MHLGSTATGVTAPQLAALRLWRDPAVCSLLPRCSMCCAVLRCTGLHVPVFACLPRVVLIRSAHGVYSSRCDYCRCLPVFCVFREGCAALVTYCGVSGLRRSRSCQQCVVSFCAPTGRGFETLECWEKKTSPQPSLNPLLASTDITLGGNMKTFYT